MATITYKILGQTVVTANTNTLLYTVPAVTSTIISSITVCNIGTSTGTFRIAMIEGAIGTVGNKNYIYYDIPIYAGDSFVTTCGFTLATTNTIMVRASSANIVFSCFGSELS